MTRRPVKTKVKEIRLDALAAQATSIIAELQVAAAELNLILKGDEV